jgi:hypothetical protein
MSTLLAILVRIRGMQPCSSLLNYLDNGLPKLGPGDWMDVIRRRKRRRLYNEIHDSLDDDAGQIQRWAEENLPLEVPNPA